MIKDAELFLVVGRRGSGKSTLTKGLLKGRPKVIVFDPRNEYGAARGWTVAYTRTEVLKVMKRNWSQGFHIAYVPEAGNEIEALHKLTLICWAAQSPYEDGRDTRKLTLVIEEADLSYPATPLPRDLSGMQRVVNQGRHVGIEVIAVTQRPALISRNFRGNVATSYVFPLADEDDQIAMLKKLGSAWKERLRTLANHHCLMCRDGQVTPMAASRDGKIRAISI